MITAALIQQLKQNNISKDGAKTSERTQAIWREASATQKNTVCDLSGCAKATVYRVFKTGGISAKLALPIAQVMQVDPLYLTGEADARGAYIEADAEKLLVSLGYNKLLADQEKAVRRAQREAAKLTKEAPAAPVAALVAAPAAAPVAAPVAVAAKEPVAAEKASLTNGIVTNEDILVLLQSLEIRAKAGIPAAKELLRQIKLLLLGA